MLQLLPLLFLAGAPGLIAPGVGQLRERPLSATPVTGMFLIPPKVPDCRTDAQIQQALAEKAAGIMPQSCDPPRSALRQSERH